MDFSEIATALKNLPSDPLSAWQMIAKTALRAAEVEITSSASSSYDDEVVNNLVAFLNDFSEASGTGVVLQTPGRSITTSRRIEIVKGEIYRETNKSAAIRLAALSGNLIDEGNDILLISNATLMDIHPKLQKLRNDVARVDMEDDKRNRLQDLLNEFERELNSKKLSKSGSLATLATVGAIILGTTTFLAEAPDAVQTVGEISSHIGAEIELAEKVAQLEVSNVPLVEEQKNETK